MTEAQVIDGKYAVVRLLGKGGMGAVYEARHLGTSRRVAVKLIVSEALAKEPEVVTRFQREARASGAVDSQHVVQVLDTGVDPATDSPYMVMEYLAGEDLFALVGRVGPLPPDLVVRVVAQACLGLQRAHDAGIIHRDIKSANLYLARRERGEIVVKVLDFGIAKVRADPLSAQENHHLTRTGSMLGSPLYMSPEQARGAKTLDGRADVWSMGVAMYEALAGTTPNGHCETLGDLILGICAEDARPITDKAPWVPGDVAAVVHKALSRDADERFSSAEEMHAALVALAPEGTAIDERMLVGIPEDLRASRSSSPAASRSGSEAARVGLYEATVALASDSSPRTPSSADAGPTTGGVAARTGPGVAGASRSRGPLVAALGLVAALAGGAALYRARASTAASGLVAEVPEAAASASPPVPPVEVLSSPSAISSSPSSPSAISSSPSSPSAISSSPSSPGAASAKGSPAPREPAPSPARSPVRSPSSGAPAAPRHEPAAAPEPTIQRTF
ncbi:MAG: protein kinase [Labilithrix sp.]|nr:protein kinase [Labilithrix sp.]